MSWKSYKELFRTKKIEESHFILGLDIGNQTSSIAFFNPLNRTPETIDLSGGYGKPSVPTTLQYITDTDEWVFGEYAVLNRGVGGDISFAGLVERLGKNDYLEINSKPVSVAYLLSLFLKELIGNCKSLNPKAEIAGIVASIPSYTGDEAKNEFLTALKLAGFDKSVISLTSDRECVFSKYCYDRPIVNETVLLLDFGGREIRGGVYDITPTDSGATIKSLSSMFDKKTGTQIIDDTITGYFTEFYESHSKTSGSLPEQLAAQISAFSYQHKDLLFQKRNPAKTVRLYYNFAYPPFSQQISQIDVENLMRPFYNRFTLFLSEILKKTASDDTVITKHTINTVICVGGGFEMHWAKELVQKAFPFSDILFYKNSKGVIAQGASIIAASCLSVVPEKTFIINDTHQIKSDIGVKVIFNGNERFIPIIERNAFWWQDHEPRSFILNEPTNKPVYIELYTRDESGHILPLDKLTIEGLPERPAGTTRIKMALEFTGYNKLSATVKDMGFGELFPVADYSQKFLVTL